MLSAAARSDQRIVVVNKSDLVSERQRQRIQAWIEEDEPGVPVFFTAATDEGTSARSVRKLLSAAVAQVRRQSPRLFSPAVNPSAGAQSRAARAISAQAAASVGHSDVQSLPLIMMVVGVPNVGKSSLINAARRIAADGFDDAKREAARRRGQQGAGSVAVGTPSGMPPMRKPRSRTPARTGKLPGVTTSLSGFQVSWRPSLWCLDTPGVLAPRVDGGWEAALRLAALDLLKYEHAAIEGVGAYVLHHLATHDPFQLERWERAYVLAERGAEATLGATPVDRRAILGSGPDPLAPRADGAQRAGHTTDAADDDGGACVDERFALILLDAVARDMNLTTRDVADHDAPPVGDTTRAASKLLAMLRRGELGDICFDAHPPELARRQAAASGSVWLSTRGRAKTPAERAQRREVRRAKRLGRAPRRIV